MKYLLFGIVLALLLLGGLYLSIAFYIGKTANRDTKIPSDVILVLGAKSYYGNSYNPCLVARVSHAVDLYKEKYAPKILVSGGVDKEDDVSEAGTMKKIAVSLGVPAKDILLESASTSTYENFLFSKKVLKLNHLKSVIIVTAPFHAPRAVLVARKLGIHFTVSPAEASPCWFPSKYFSIYFLREPLAIMWYKIKDRL